MLSKLRRPSDGREVQDPGEDDRADRTAEHRHREPGAGRHDEPDASASTPRSAACAPCGAIALPTIDASAATPTTAANHTAPWSCERSQNARWKNVKPTLARSTVMAIAPSCRLDAVSWVDSS